MAVVLPPARYITSAARYSKISSGINTFHKLHWTIIQQCGSYTYTHFHFFFTVIVSLLAAFAYGENGSVDGEWAGPRQPNESYYLRHSRLKRSSDVEVFFENEQNKATYIVLPLIILVYGGCSSIYCIYKCRRYLKRQRLQKLKTERLDRDDSIVEKLSLGKASTDDESNLTSKASANITEILNLNRKSKSQFSDDHFIQDIEMVPLDDLEYDNNVERLNSKVSPVQKSEIDRSRTVSSESLFSRSNNASAKGKHTPISRMSEIFVVADENNLDKSKFPHMPDVIPYDDENSKLIIKRKKLNSKIYLAWWRSLHLNAFDINFFVLSLSW